MSVLKINEGIQVSGHLFIQEGKALNRTLDNWDFYPSKTYDAGQNVICTAGLYFVFQRNWGIPMSVAIGNGSVAGTAAPASTDTTLNNELVNARFAVRGNQYSRIDNDRVTLSALWSAGNNYTGQVTEWGLFVNETGVPVVGRETGYLLSRRAFEFYRTDPSKDVQILWVITISAT